ncbi:MAG: 30S ribosomal protein S1 [Proteobacteria bacterium]|nr:30S ribosomal protein S1 [Pseudomonadota bacterium]
MTEAAENKYQNIEFVDEEFDFDQHVTTFLENLKELSIVEAKATKISKDFVTVDFGYKSQGLVPVQEFTDESGELLVEIGDTVEIYLERLEDEHGQVVVSKEKAKKLRIWEDVGQIYDDDGTVSGIITARIKGGLSVDIGIKAFLPGSQVDLRPVRNLDKLLGERFDFKVLKYNPKRGNIVLSRRAILEIDREEQRKKTLEQLQEGTLINGHVKNITDYGIFVDLGGVDGLLHITDMTWGRIVHPSEMFAVGEEIEVMILKFDEEDGKVSLGLKQKSSNPWDAVAAKYPIGTEVIGKVVSLTNYGAFIEIEEGVEGLIHVSEMSWTKKIRQPSSVVSLNDEVSAVIKELDTEQRRISLSMKEALPNPWEEIAERTPTGTVVKGKIRNITDFGIFVGLDEGIDGLVHVSDMSWSQRQRNPNEVYEKNDEIDVKILNIDVDSQRLSLGIKQLQEDPWKDLELELAVESLVSGKVVHIADFGVFLEIKPGVEGLIHVSEIDKEVSKKSLSEFYPIGSELQAKVINLKMNERRLGLSINGLTDDEIQLKRPEGIPAPAEVTDKSPEADETPKGSDESPEAADAAESKQEAPKEASEASDGDTETEEATAESSESSEKAIEADSKATDSDVAKEEASTETGEQATSEEGTTE